MRQIKGSLKPNSMTRWSYHINFQNVNL